MTTQMRPKLLFVAMLLATVALAACGGDESEQPPKTPTLAQEPTAAPSAALTATAQPASATPTAQPGSATPQAIDTSAWLTYTSPRGYSIQYPPDWTVDVVNENHLRLVNSVTARVFEDALARGLVHVGPVPGMAQLNILLDDRAFDVAEQIELCERPPNTDLSQRDAHAQVTTFAGYTAVLCQITRVVPTDLVSTGLSMRFEFSPGQSLTAGGGVYAPGDIALLEAILNSLKLLEGIQLSPPASPR
jgi:hypothetical protein